MPCKKSMKRGSITKKTVKTPKKKISKLTYKKK